MIDTHMHSHRLDLGALAGRYLTDDRYPYGIFPVRHAGELKDGAQCPGVHITHRLAEWPLFFKIICRYDPFQNDLGSGRDLEVHGLALDEPDRFPNQTAGQSHFVDMRGDLLRGRVGNGRNRADSYRHFQRNPLFSAVFPMAGKILWRAGHNPA